MNQLNKAHAEKAAKYRKMGINGELRLPVWGDKHFVVLGGPFRNRPKGTVGVKMAQEIYAECDISIATQDFSTPPPEAMRVGLIKAVKAVIAGQPLYVGCMGGMGRTGLFLAVLAKAFGVKKPVEYVRQHYYSHAVETDEQYRYVMNYPIPVQVRLMIAAARGKSFFLNRDKVCLTNTI